MILNMYSNPKIPCGSFMSCLPYAVLLQDFAPRLYPTQHPGPVRTASMCFIATYTCFFSLPMRPLLQAEELSHEEHPLLNTCQACCPDLQQLLSRHRQLRKIKFRMQSV